MPDRAGVPGLLGCPTARHFRDFVEAVRTFVRAFLQAAGLAVVATTVLLDLPFNFANVIILPLLFGLGVAGSPGLSGHPGTASMGLLLAIAITLSMVCSLVVLPALMATFGPTR